MPIQFALDFSAAAAAPVPADYWRPEDFVAAPAPLPEPAPVDPWDSLPVPGPVLARSALDDAFLGDTDAMAAHFRASRAAAAPAPVPAAVLAADAAAARAASRPRRSFRRVLPPAPADSAAAVAAFLASRSVTVCPVRYAAPVAGC